MKIRVADRILVAIAGLIILAFCTGIAAQVFFNADVAGWLGNLLSPDADWGKIAIGAACILLLLIGGYCVLLLFRHRSRRDRFILQKMESGDLAISLKALEKMVTRCLEQRKEIETQSVKLENQRDGLIIRIHGTVAGGISIPLTVDMLQKQIKQYVTACSGVEVKGIRVQIESSGEEAKDAPFTIDAPEATPLLQSAEREEEAVPEEPVIPETAPETPADPIPAAAVSATTEAALQAAENLKKEYEDDTEDNRPIHQRLFSTPEEPCIMPLPPEDLDLAETTAAPEPEDTEEKKPGSGEEEPAAEAAADPEKTKDEEY